ncbi:MAG: hypothetical protein D6737_01000 [Chloroflexi bacterium]|nr:MAG: hypothetical protein CUN54_00785 [Phototrophicales bacterium]RMF82711.1 MAG: hypothetical protein D6737_01000 [Chloroflexota bacterium]
MATLIQTSKNQIKFSPPSPLSYKKPLFVALVIVAMMVGSFLYLSDDTLMQGAAATTSTVDAEIAALTPNEVGEILLRNGVGPNDTALDILYAPTWYFDWNQRTLPDTTEPVLAFFVMETIHSGQLIDEPPQALLQVDDKLLEPLRSEVVSDAPHHRVSQVLFNLFDADGKPYITDDSEQITLVTPIDGLISSGNTYRWDLPLPYGLGALNTPNEFGSPVRGALTWTAFFAIMGGMLSALSPCLLQLAVYYTAVLTGTEASVGAQAGQPNAARLELMKTSFYFVGGFTLVYTAGGVLAGYVGQSLEQLAGLEQWFRPISVVSGVLIIIMAVRVALQAKAPLVCRIPMRVGAGTGRIASATMGLSFAIGCLSCFSATVLSALLLYAGSTGSPISGGMLLFLFSSGVGLVFLTAAWGIGSATPQMTDWLQRSRPLIGGISALVMVVFGLLMITYEFHTVSGFLFKLFNS